MGDVDPVLLLATTDATSRDVLGSELRRRYGGDYEVVVCAELRARPRGARGAAPVGTTGRAGHRLLRSRRPRRPRLPAPRLLAAPVGQAGGRRRSGATSPAPSDVFAAIAHGHAELVARPARAPARRGVPRRDHRRAGRLAPRAGRRLRGGADDRRAARRAHPRAARPVRPQPHPRRLPPGRHASPPTGCSPGSGSSDPELPVRRARLHHPAHDARRARPTSRSPTPSG